MLGTHSGDIFLSKIEKKIPAIRFSAIFLFVKSNNFPARRYSAIFLFAKSKNFLAKKPFAPSSRKGLGQDYVLPPPPSPPTYAPPGFSLKLEVMFGTHSGDIFLRKIEPFSRATFFGDISLRKIEKISKPKRHLPSPSGKGSGQDYVFAPLPLKSSDLCPHWFF